MIAILATGVVFAMTGLIMTGLSNGFEAEA